MHMRKFLLFGLLLVSMLSACDKDDNDPAPGERPDERLEKTLGEYKSQLVSAEHGWKATLFPEGGAGYSFLFRFLENDRVVTLSDISAAAATTPLESTYRLKAGQQPSLLFDTYTYLHILADPDETKSGGERGQGRSSDYEFSFEEVSPDSIVLTGNYNGSRLVLVRATAEEASNYIPRINEHIQAFEGINNFSLYFKQLTIGGQSFDIRVNTTLRTITFTYDDGSGMKSFTTGYYYTLDGVTLLQPLRIGDLTIANFNDLEYQASQNRIDLTVNGVAGSIREASKPASIDTQLARAFYNNPANGTYWLTEGFVVEGVEDAFQLSTLPDFSLLVYWPKFDDAEGTLFDLMGFVFGNSIRYGPAAVPSFPRDGRIIFQELGMLGEVPAEHAPIIEAFTQQWTDPEGYYVVQTSPSTYDLVSAKDAKTWISFE